MLAASHGHFITCKLLLECGSAINVQDNDGSTALMCATEHGHIEVVRLLLSHPDCDPSVSDNVIEIYFYYILKLKITFLNRMDQQLWE